MPQPDIRSLVDAFVADLEQVIRAEALNAVQGALGGVAAPARRGPGRPRKKAKRGPGRPRKAKASKAPRRAKAGKRVRRSPEELEAMQGDVLAWVRSHPGEGVEAISQGLGLPSKELKRPIQMLIADGKLRTEGQKRGTTYFGGGGGGRMKAVGTRKKATNRSGKKASKRQTGEKHGAKGTTKRKTASKKKSTGRRRAAGRA